MLNIDILEVEFNKLKIIYIGINFCVDWWIGFEGNFFKVIFKVFLSNSKILMVLFLFLSYVLI